VAFISDTLPTDRIWELARDCPNLKAVFLEVSFPNAMTWLAEAAAHLTPDTFRTELAKLGRDVPVVAIHLKPRFRSELEREIHALQLPQIQIGRAGQVFEF
jgi:ribonuclease BN (tRNA processing enzyme)